jgi:hypothetical protein
MRVVHWSGMIIVIAAVSLLALSNPDMVSLKPMAVTVRG